MYEVKNKIFLEFTKTQKTALCNFLRALTKKELNLDAGEILTKFLEDEHYYLEINASRFEFLNDILNDEKFISDAKSYIKECKKYYEYKKTQEPLIRAQKDFERQKRKFLQEVKMSKEKPTKKQIYYYKTLCKRYNVVEIVEEELNSKSKFDFKNMIEEILNEHKTN